MLLQSSWRLVSLVDCTYTLLDDFLYYIIHKSYCLGRVISRDVDGVPQSLTFVHLDLYNVIKLFPGMHGVVIIHLVYSTLQAF